MNVLITICARAGSKGVKSKNIRDFLGYPICWYTLAAYRLFCEKYGEKYGAFDLAVNTDAPELYEQVERAGVAYLKVPRKPELAGDTVEKGAVLRDTMKVAQEMTGKIYDCVVDMDLTSPLRRVEDIDNIIQVFFANPEAEAALSVTESRRNPWFNQMVRGEDGFYRLAIQSDFIARQQAPEVFDANASLYVYSPKFLSESDRILIRAKLVCSHMLDTGVLDIDCERDFELMQLLAKYYYENDPAFGEIYDEVRRLGR